MVPEKSFEMGFECFSFGEEFQVVDEGSRRHLLRSGKDIGLNFEGCGVLLALVKRPHIVISRDELITAGWSANGFVSENSVDKAISEIRLALDDRRKPYRYIETVKRRGYKFLVNATACDSPNVQSFAVVAPEPGTEEINLAAPLVEPLSTCEQPERPNASRAWRNIRRRWISYALLSVAAASLVVTAISAFWPRQTPLPVILKPETSVVTNPTPTFGTEGSEKDTTRIADKRSDAVGSKPSASKANSLESSSKSKTSVARATQLYEQALRLYEVNKFEEALAICETAIRLDPSNNKVRSLMRTLQSHKGVRNKATRTNSSGPLDKNHATSN